VPESTVATELNDALVSVLDGPMRRLLGLSDTATLALEECERVVQLPPSAAAIAAKRATLLYTVWASFEVRAFFCSRDPEFTKRLVAALPLAMPPFLASQAQYPVQFVRQVIGLVTLCPFATATTHTSRPSHSAMDQARVEADVA
jgi:hypothetical protein